MKNYLGYIIAVATLITSITECSVVNNAIKSGDPQYAYQQALTLYENEKWSQASTLFEACRHIYMDSPRGDSLTFYNARCKFKEHNWDVASTELDAFRRKYAKSPFLEEAEGMYALCHYYMAPPPERDQTMTSQAIIAITEFMSRYPESDKIPEFQEMLDDLSVRLEEKCYMNAYTYYKIGRYKSAIVAFKNAIKKYPDSKRNEDMMYYMTLSAYKLAENSVESKQEDRYLAMLDNYYSFLAEHPESKYLKELERMAKNARTFLDKRQKTEATI
jgi:outer membrane protein assembly factor BamD